MRNDVCKELKVSKDAKKDVCKELKVSKDAKKDGVNNVYGRAMRNSVLKLTAATMACRSEECSVADLSGGLVTTLPLLF